jgi:hypothetical protein
MASIEKPSFKQQLHSNAMTDERKHQVPHRGAEVACDPLTPHAASALGVPLASFLEGQGEGLISLAELSPPIKLFRFR